MERSNSELSVNKRVKRILNDIIDVAFSDESDYMRSKYKDFTIRILDDTLKTRDGKYDARAKALFVNNLYRGSGAVIKTCLHELSHHVEFVKNGETGHQKPFYLVYRRLLYASLDMGIAKKSDFTDPGSRDYQKVRSILEEYIPHPVPYTNSEKRVIVRNGYDIKEKLNALGFRWNKIEQVWEAPFSDDTEDILKKYGIEDYEVVDATARIEAVLYLFASGKTIDFKEKLHSEGFFYNSDNKLWLKKVKADDFQKVHDRYANDPSYRGVTFGIFKK